VISCVLYDLDGVLLDAREIHYEALNMALVEAGYEPISRLDHETTFNGLPTKKKLEMLGVDPQVSKLKQKHTVRLLKSLNQESKSELAELPCIFGVCTNAVKETLKIGLEKCGLYPDVALSNEDVVENKPDPEIYLTAMSILGVGPEETLIVEDSPHGLEAAKRSGAHVMRVGGVEEVTKRSVDEFVNSSAGGWKWKEIQGRRLQGTETPNSVPRQDDDRACSGEHKTRSETYGDSGLPASQL